MTPLDTMREAISDVERVRDSRETDTLASDLRVGDLLVRATIGGTFGRRVESLQVGPVQVIVGMHGGMRVALGAFEVVTVRREVRS